MATSVATSGALSNGHSDAIRPVSERWLCGWDPGQSPPPCASIPSFLKWGPNGPLHRLLGDKM